MGGRDVAGVWETLDCSWGTSKVWAASHAKQTSVDCGWWQITVGQRNIKTTCFLLHGTTLFILS